MLYLFLCLLSCQIGYSSDNNQVTFESYATSGYVRGVEKSIKSSVVLQCYKDGEQVGNGSGNYLQEGGHKFILTANHVINNCDDVHIVDRYGSTVLAKVKHSDKERDVAILVPENKLENVNPVKLRLEKSGDILGKEIYFMGHPDELNFFLFKGIAAMEPDKDIFLHSTAWAGTSGAVVFSREGKVVGVVSAVKVVMDPITGWPRILEDLVLVSKADFISRRFLKNIMDGK